MHDGCTYVIVQTGSHSDVVIECTKPLGHDHRHVDHTRGIIFEAAENWCPSSSMGDRCALDPNHAGVLHEDVTGAHRWSERIIRTDA